MLNSSGKKLQVIFLITFLLLFLVQLSVHSETVFQSAWPENITQRWIGPEYWSNLMRDWRISNGRLECVDSSLPMRTVHLLPCALKKKGELTMSVRTGLIEEGSLKENSWSGFLLGAGSGEIDYRAAALVHHSPGKLGGIIAGVDGKGRAAFRGNYDAAGHKKLKATSIEGKGFAGKKHEDVELRLSLKPSENGGCDITLSVYSDGTDELLSRATLKDYDSVKLEGNIALVANTGIKVYHYWFRDWKVGGSRVEYNKDRIFGPILCAQYTVHDKVLKLTAQMAMLAREYNQKVTLELRDNEGQAWKAAATEEIIADSYTVLFRIENWDPAKKKQYRVVYSMADENGTDYIWEGTIQPDPLNENEIKVAVFTGNAIMAIKPGWDCYGDNIRWTDANLKFPHNSIVEHARSTKPHLLVFTGDQVYEDWSRRKPEHIARVDYHSRWQLWCWAFRDIVKDTPCICLPDDHDVFHPNLWGWDGRTSPDGNWNNGGYVMSPGFVNMVERTQVSHLPDPYDSTPVHQGIGVYYAPMNLGGISFAIIEDRKFKSPNTIITTADIWDGHIQNSRYDPGKADVDGAQLLGERQLEFLREWAMDWSSNVEMKAVLSQTIFANLQTFNENMPNKEFDQDTDSNGWPQSGRNRALREIRKGFAVMLAGDQHLASIIHHGIEEWNDAGYSLCCPSISNFWVRYWNPVKPGNNRVDGMPGYTGEYLDGFGNHITVWAVANPSVKMNNPIRGNFDKTSTGYSIARFNKNERTITFECYPRGSDPGNLEDQYEGWPKTIKQEDNYGTGVKAHLPEMDFKMDNPVIQVINESNSEVLYTIRIRGRKYTPKVFREGSYTVMAGSDKPERKVAEHIKAVLP